MTRQKKTEVVNCAICGCAIKSAKPNVVEGHYACSEEIAAQLGIPTSGVAYPEACLECREKEQGSRLQ